MYGFHILHKFHRFPHEWINLPYHEKIAIFAFIDEKVRRDKQEEAKRKAQQNSASKGRRVSRGKRR